MMITGWMDTRHHNEQLKKTAVPIRAELKCKPACSEKLLDYFSIHVVVVLIFIVITYLAVAMLS